MTHLSHHVCVSVCAYICHDGVSAEAHRHRCRPVGRDGTKDHISDKHFDSDERERVKHVFARPSPRSVRPSDGTAWRGGNSRPLYMCVCVYSFPCLHIHRQ